MTCRTRQKVTFAGQEYPDWLADHAKGTLSGKRPELRRALRGRITDHHRLMLRELMEDLCRGQAAADREGDCQQREC